MLRSSKAILEQQTNHARIRAARDRILAGRPERSNGALTIVALAVEAGVPPTGVGPRRS
ncbi:hypothetical protein GCM10012286_81260 [Streptomyces lasiicapitis]|uniref:TetR family transcriptional regulator n=1 Tax=Streptomyces lasiicapitis TaxID=1923961 RepID=A0ABQ2MXC2_9ACTN|nr:hypothetical protein GCM10012286_81260 [Streptomyces lasiicapitis]